MAALKREELVAGQGRLAVAFPVRGALPGMLVRRPAALLTALALVGTLGALMQDPGMPGAKVVTVVLLAAMRGPLVRDREAAPPVGRTRSNTAAGWLPGNRR